MHKIFIMQEKLDQAIHKAHKINPKKIISMRIVALLIEIAEFANEIQPFKYWKKDKKTNKLKILEEFVDGIHFFVSLAIQINLKPKFTPKIISNNPTTQLLQILKNVINLNDNFQQKKLKKAFELYMGIAKMYKITYIEIEKFYIAKNKINYKRILNNY